MRKLFYRLVICVLVCIVFCAYVYGGAVPRMLVITCPFSKLTDVRGDTLKTSGLRFEINLISKKVTAQCVGADETICILDGKTEVLEIRSIQGDPLGSRGSGTVTIEGNNGDSTQIYVRLGLMPKGSEIQAKGFLSTGADEAISDLSDFVSCAADFER